MPQGHGGLGPGLSFRVPLAAGSRLGKAGDMAAGVPDLVREADRLVLARYAPAGVIIDETMNILHFRGQTGAFLEPAPGEASLNLLRMTRETLGREIRAAMQTAIQGNSPVRKEGLRLRTDGGLHGSTWKLCRSGRAPRDPVFPGAV